MTPPAELMEQLLSGNIWVILQPYLDLFGEYFYAMLAFMVIAVVFVRTEEPAIVAIVTIALFIPAVTVLPIEFHKIGFFTVVLGLAATVFKLFYGRGD